MLSWIRIKKENDVLKGVAGWISAFFRAYDRKSDTSIHLNGFLSISHSLHKIKIHAGRVNAKIDASHWRCTHVPYTLSHSALCDISRIKVNISMYANAQAIAWKSWCGIWSVNNQKWLYWFCCGEGDPPPLRSTGCTQSLWRYYFGWCFIIISRGVCRVHRYDITVTSWYWCLTGYG